MKHIRLFLGLLAAASAGTAGAKTLAPETRPKVEVAFVLDTTGSMGGLIEGAKQKIWSIANEIATAKPSPEVRFALIGYRDRGDDYVTRTFDLSDDLDAIYGQLMEFQAQGGGDSPESVNQALDEAVRKLSWSGDTTTLKIVFLVGDAPPHMDYQDDVKYPATCETAVKKDLIINTIQCGSMGGTREIWEEIARRGEGEYVAIEQSGGMRAISTPMDEDISRLNTVIAGTVITYGNRKAQLSGAAKVARLSAVAPEAAASRAEYMAVDAFAAGEVNVAISGNEDLVKQLDNDEIKDEEIRRDYLPEPLQKMSEEELKAHVAAQSETRKQAQGELDALLRKRQTYIDAERKRLAEAGEGDGFDAKVNEMIRSQAAAKGIRYGAE